jgi:C1A family cysteine protease
MSEILKNHGWVPDKYDSRDLVYVPLTEQLSSLSSEIDLRSQCPPIYNQETLASCTANAIVAAVEFQRRKQRLLDIRLSRLFVYYNEREREGTVNLDCGAQIRDGIKTVVAQGICSESEWPYDITKFAVKPPPNCYQNALKDRVVKYKRLSQNLEHMKECLMSTNPFIFGLFFYESFLSIEVARTGIVPMPNDEERKESPHHHAVLAVGYNDSEKCFIARSSSGQQWGMQGYFTIPYSYVTDSNLADDFWVIELIEQD